MDKIIEVIAKDFIDEKNDLTDICGFIKKRLEGYKIMLSRCKMDEFDYLNELYCYLKYNSYRKYSLSCVMEWVYFKLISKNRHDNLIYLDNAARIDEDGEYVTFLDLCVKKDFPYESIDELECKIYMEQILECMKLILSDKEFDLLMFGFGFNGERKIKSQSQAAIAFDMSMSMVSRMEKRALVKLRRGLQGKYDF